MFLFYGSPGPATFSLGTIGLSQDFQSAWPYVLGILLGLFTNISLVAVGLMSLFERYPEVFQALKYLGVGYILYLSWKLHRTEITWDQPTKLTFLDGILLNTLNPKAYLGSMLVIEQASNISDFKLDATYVIGLVMVVGIVVDLLWFFAGVKMKVFLSQKRHKIVNSALALLLAVVGVYGLLID